MTVRVAVFAMADANHFAGVHAVMTELVRAGAQVRCWTATPFADQLKAAGAEFADLFASRPIDAVDNTSRPLPSRFVTFAAVHGRALIAEAGAWQPDIVVYDGFALIGRLVAEALGAPLVVVNTAHALYGPDYRIKLAADPRVLTDPRCVAAVEQLKSEFGLANASPFSYVADPSPWLNVQVEPAEWLDEGEKRGFGNVAFFGPLSPEQLATKRPSAPRRTGPRVYAAFGTIIWRYWTREALAALAAIAEGVSRMPGAEAVMSLGGTTVTPAERAALERPNVRVESYVDQWATLAAGDIFVTHHGAASTHEAVALGVPMLSYPFFWDQPALAAKAQSFGIATPLIESALGVDSRLTPEHVVAAIDTMQSRQSAMEANLAKARRWEEASTAARPSVARQILDLARPRTRA